jgi:dienelactone hydrolase
LTSASTACFVEPPSPQGHGKLRGYLVKPAAPKGPLPLVLVLAVHENRGLSPHIDDITRRMALCGFVAFAPDALFSLGGYPSEEGALPGLCVYAGTQHRFNNDTTPRFAATAAKLAWQRTVDFFKAYWMA